MKLSIFLSLLCCGSLVAANSPKPEATPVPMESGMSGRIIQYGERDVVPVRARLRFTTLIVLPKNEQIMDFVCGDKEFWVVNGAQNFAYV